MPNKYVIDDHRLYDAIATPFWENRAFVIAWFSSGLYVFQIRRIWRKDEGLLLLIAKHYSKRDAVSLFKRLVAPVLLNNKTFVQRVITSHPALLYETCVPNHLQSDFDLVVTAFAGSPELVQN